MNKSILFSGYYGFDNSGDDAILEAISTDLKKTRPQLNIKVLSYHPEKTKEMYQIEALYRFNLKEVLKGLKETDLFISGGGSLLQDITSSRSLWYYLGLMLLAKIFGKKVYVYANGVGPIDGRFNRFLTKHVLNMADYITLRDRMSLDFIRSIGVKHDRVKVTADPVYTLEPAGDERIKEILRQEGIPDKEYLGFAVRAWKEAPDLGQKLAFAMNGILKNSEEDILMLPLHYPEDVKFAEKVRNMVVEKERVYILKENYSVKELMGSFSRLNTVVAMRLHSLIYGVVEKVPIVGLSYDPKVEGLLKELDLPAGVDVNEFDPEELIEKIFESLENREERAAYLAGKREDLKQAALENIEVIDVLLEDEG